MNTKNEVVNLDELLAKRTAILDGEEIEVLPVDGVGYQLLKEMQDNGDTSALRMYDVVARCIPAVPKERVMKMSPSQIGTLLSLATESVTAVEASVPNGVKPKGKGKATGTPPAQ